MRRGRSNRGRDGGNRNNRGGRNNNRGGGGRRGYRSRGRGGRQSAESGNKRERISIESGYLVLIDQFMLANAQFIERVLEVIDEDPDVKDEIIRDYGGTVVELSPDTYRIDRDPYGYSIIIHPEGESPSADEVREEATDEYGTVFIDTRCLAMIDRELLDDSALFEKYRQLWFSGQDKACRDLLRDNGGAVRYGFGRYGDDLGVLGISERDVVGLWPRANLAKSAEDDDAETVDSGEASSA